MKIGIVGRGPWGDVYAKNLQELGVDFWQSGRVFFGMQADGVIVASEPHSHFDVAKAWIRKGVPVLIEKPVCMNTEDVRELLCLAEDLGVSVLTGHTRLYSPAWGLFRWKAWDIGVRSVWATAGGPCKLPPWWDWGPHLAALCLDLGADPVIYTTSTPTPLRVVVNGTLVFDDPPTEPTPMQVLLLEFISTITARDFRVDGLKLGLRVIDFLERNEDGDQPFFSEPYLTALRGATPW